MPSRKQNLLKILKNDKISFQYKEDIVFQFNQKVHNKKNLRVFLEKNPDITRELTRSLMKEKNTRFNNLSTNLQTRIINKTFKTKTSIKNEVSFIYQNATKDRNYLIYGNRRVEFNNEGIYTSTDKGKRDSLGKIHLKIKPAYYSYTQHKGLSMTKTSQQAIREAHEAIAYIRHAAKAQIKIDPMTKKPVDIYYEDEEKNYEYYETGGVRPNRVIDRALEAVEVRKQSIIKAYGNHVYNDMKTLVRKIKQLQDKGITVGYGLMNLKAYQRLPNALKDKVINRGQRIRAEEFPEGD
jgi:hypothetical protein